jgi:hypothetical protein
MQVTVRGPPAAQRSHTVARSIKTPGQGVPPVHIAAPVAPGICSFCAMGSPPRSPIEIHTEGEVSATVSIANEGHAAEITVWGKLVFALGDEGELSLVATPELPGYNAGAPDANELDPGNARRIIVRGSRSLGGRVILRRGTNALAELEFGPGSEHAIASLANTMQTTIAGRRGDEWLVVDGVLGPQSRRWCKLPKLGVFATWSDPSASSLGPTSIPALERLLLTSRLCFVDVASWTVSFVMRGSRKVLARTVPDAVTVSIQDLGSESLPGGVLGRRVPLPPASPLPPSSRLAPSVHHFESGPTVMSRKDEPVRPNFFEDDTTTGIHLTTEDFIESSIAAPPIEDEKTVQSLTRPAPKRSPSSGGLRLGPPPLPKTPAKPEIEDESSISRAFAALTAPPDSTAAPVATPQKPTSLRDETTMMSAVNPKESPVVKKR